MVDCSNLAQQRMLRWWCIVVLCVGSVLASRPSSSSITFLPSSQITNRVSTRSSSIPLSKILRWRGGSTAASDEMEETAGETSSSATPDVDEAEEEEEEETKSDTPSLSSQLPVKLLIKTNFRNAVMDEKVELMAARTRDVASLKKSLSRQLPGRPPVLSLQLMYEGRLLQDEELVDELFDEDDEDEEDDEEDDGLDGASKVLVLNSIPPVDPKFATELAPKLKSHYDADEETLTTEELIRAYFLNQVAISRNAQLLMDPNAPTSPTLALDSLQQAEDLIQQLKDQTNEDVWESSLQSSHRKTNLEERRGQRYRSGKGGARTNLKKSIQTNLNIHWGETIRNFFLFLFFGFFGGRNSLSRTLMLWGAPMCFILQARPVKIWSKILFYMMAHPPGIISSLLPAPQQAILNADDEASFSILYSEEAQEAMDSETSEHAEEEEEEDDEDEDEEEEESEDEDEEEDEDESEEEEEDESEDEDEDDDEYDNESDEEL